MSVQLNRKDWNLDVVYRPWSVNFEVWLRPLMMWQCYFHNRYEWGLGPLHVDFTPLVRHADGTWSERV